jgi:hypothetical protein
MLGSDSVPRLLALFSAPCQHSPSDPGLLLLASRTHPHPNLQVYTVTTNSNNNTWLRRKLLEAVGASRRFYNASNRTGRPKASRRSPASSSGGATPKPRKQQAVPAMPTTPTACPTALHHPAFAVGPALPAGSPRALMQRMRSTAAASASTTALNDAHAASPRHAHHQLQHAFLPTPRFQRYTSQRAQSSEEEGGASSNRSSGDDTHPRALRPAGAVLDCASPTCASAFGAASGVAGAEPVQHYYQQHYQQHYQQLASGARLPAVLDSFRWAGAGACGSCSDRCNTGPGPSAPCAVKRVGFWAWQRLALYVLL